MSIARAQPRGYSTQFPAHEVLRSRVLERLAEEDQPAFFDSTPFQQQDQTVSSLHDPFSFEVPQLEASTSATAHTDRIVSWLQANCQIQDTMLVRTFLQDHWDPGIGHLLQEGIARAKMIFGPATVIRASVESDPEADDCSELAIFIESLETDEVALQMLEEFDRSWWESNLPRTRGLISFHVRLM